MPATAVRYLVTASAVLIAIGYAARDFSTVAPTLPAPDPNAGGQVPLEVSRAIFDACVTFYGCAYGVGKVGYRLLGRRSELRELQRWSRWHMWLLNGLGGVWLCVSTWQSFHRQNVIRPAAVVGVMLLALAGISVAKAARAGNCEPHD